MKTLADLFEPGHGFNSAAEFSSFLNQAPVGGQHLLKCSTKYDRWEEVHAFIACFVDAFHASIGIVLRSNISSCRAVVKFYCSECSSGNKGHYLLRAKFQGWRFFIPGNLPGRPCSHFMSSGTIGLPSLAQFPTNRILSKEEFVAAANSGRCRCHGCGFYMLCGLEEKDKMADYARRDVTTRAANRKKNNSNYVLQTREKYQGNGCSYISCLRDNFLLLLIPHPDLTATMVRKRLDLSDPQWPTIIVQMFLVELPKLQRGLPNKLLAHVYTAHKLDRVMHYTTDKGSAQNMIQQFQALRPRGLVRIFNNHQNHFDPDCIYLPVVSNAEESGSPLSTWREVFTRFGATWLRLFTVVAKTKHLKKYGNFSKVYGYAKQGQPNVHLRKNDGKDDLPVDLAEFLFHMVTELFTLMQRQRWGAKYQHVVEAAFTPARQRFQDEPKEKYRYNGHFALSPEGYAVQVVALSGPHFDAMNSDRAMRDVDHVFSMTLPIDHWPGACDAAKEEFKDLLGSHGLPTDAVRVLVTLYNRVVVDREPL